MGLRSQYGPAAGASGGREPLETTLYVPDFLRLDRAELFTLLQQIREPLVSHVFLLVLANCVFETGEFLGSYARLISLSTPEREGPGRKVIRPTMKQMRRAVDVLVDMHLLRRGLKNEEQGQLRLRATPRKEARKPAKT